MGSPLPDPLTPEEEALARTITVYVVWYEDHFHFGEDSDSWPVRIYRTRREAEEDRDVIENPPPAWDAYVVRERSLESLPPQAVRDVLNRIGRGESGPVEIDP